MSDKPAQVVKPRAESGARFAKKRSHTVRNVVLGGTAVGIFAALYHYNFSWTDFMTDVKNTLDSMREKSTNSDPTIDELKSALGPPAPEGIISVIMSLDEVVMRRDWDRRYGWRYELRPGVKAMMKQLADQGCIVSFWSQGAAAGVIDAVNKMSLEFGMPMAITQTHLGVEHCFSRADGRKEKHIEFFNRNPQSILLVDTDELSEMVNPHNTLLVKGMTEVEKEVTEAAAAGRAVAADDTLAAIVSMVHRIRSDFQQWGRVDVPRTLHLLRGEAQAAGYGADAAGLYAFMKQQTAEAQEMERLRRETGLGGALRRTIDKSSTLRGASVVDAAEAKPFRDPVIDAGESSLLTRKVHNALARMEGGHGR